MDGLPTRKMTPASPVGGGVTFASSRTSLHVKFSMSALQPGAPPVGVDWSLPLCTHQPPPNHDHPAVLLSAKSNETDRDVGLMESPSTGKSVSRKSSAPNGTSVI